MNRFILFFFIFFEFSLSFRRRDFLFGAVVPTTGANTTNFTADAVGLVTQAGDMEILLVQIRELPFGNMAHIFY